MNNKVFTAKKRNALIAAVIVVLLAVALLGGTFTIVDAGHTGVVVTLGKVKEGVLQEGIHAKIPFIQQVVKIDNRIRKLEVNTEAFSKDLQSVNTVLAINYRVDTAKSYSIYKNIGADYETVLVIPAVNEVLKAITATYTAEESVTNRSLISDGLVSGLNEKLNDIGLYVTDVQSRGRGDEDPRRGRSRGQPQDQPVADRSDHRKQKNREMGRRAAKGQRKCRNAGRFR